MKEQRKLIRLDVADFLEIRPLDESQAPSRAQGKNITFMGICFSSQAQWEKGQFLLINYFLPEDLDSVKLKVSVAWSEFIGPEVGYFCGGQIIDIEPEKEKKFINYYFQRLKDRFYK